MWNDKSTILTDFDLYLNLLKTKIKFLTMHKNLTKSVNHCLKVNLCRENLMLCIHTTVQLIIRKNILRSRSQSDIKSSSFSPANFILAVLFYPWKFLCALLLYLSLYQWLTSPEHRMNCYCSLHTLLKYNTWYLT